MELGYPFAPAVVGGEYMQWPLLTELFPTFFPGVQTKRDELVIDIDRDCLVRRMKQYFDPSISNDQMRQISPRAMARTNRKFDPIATRKALTARGFLPNYIVRHLYRPFDRRLLYWEPETELLGRKSPDYFSQVFSGNAWFGATQQNRKNFDPPVMSSELCSLHVIERSVSMFPLYLRDAEVATFFSASEAGERSQRANLSASATSYVRDVGAQASVQELFYHAVSVQHSSQYYCANIDALRQNWPRIPLPSERSVLASSAKLGEQIAALFDTEREIPDVTTGRLRPELRDLAVISRVGGGGLDPVAGELALTARWGIAGRDGVTMPSTGKLAERDFTPDECAALERGAESLGLTLSRLCELLGATTYDVYLNDVAYWRNIPTSVWHYTLGGYQVIKKWLSYRERPILGRDMTADEVREVTGIARRIAALILLGPALDENYAAITRSLYALPSSNPSAAPAGQR